MIGNTGVDKLMDFAFDSLGTMWATVANELYLIDTSSGIDKVGCRCMIINNLISWMCGTGSYFVSDLLCLSFKTILHIKVCIARAGRRDNLRWKR